MQTWKRKNITILLDINVYSIYIDLQTFMLERQHPTPNLTDRHLSHNTDMSEPKNNRAKKGKNTIQHESEYRK